jgi:glutathione S-transferase
MNSKAKLGYWAIRGLAQPIRLVLAYAAIDFEDELYVMPAGAPWPQSPKWLAERDALGLAFPNLPFFISGELRLTQSHAILLHVAGLAGLLGSTPAIAAEALMLMELSRDVRDPYVALSYSSRAEFAANRENVVASFRGILDKLEAFARQSAAFLLGEFTFVDLVWSDLLEQLVTLSPDILSNCPTLQALVAAVWALPNVAAYRACPRFIDKPYNNTAASFRGYSQEER